MKPLPRSLFVFACQDEDISAFPRLDLAAIISNASLIITKSQVQSVEKSTSSKPQDAPNGLDGVKEANGVNGSANQRPSE